MSKKIIKTDKAPVPIGPYSQAVHHKGFLFVSGQVAIDPATGNLVMDTLENETEQVMKNLHAVLKQANAKVDDIVMTTIFLSDMSLFAAVNEIYGSYFKKEFPARATVAVKGLPKNVNVEISVIAAV